VELAAGVLGVKVQYHDVLSANDIEPVFRAAARGRADAVLIITSNAITNFSGKEAVELAIKNRLPLIHESARAVVISVQKLPI